MGVLLRLLWTCSRWLFIGGGSVPLPPPRSDSCSSIRHLRSGSFLPLRNLLRMLRLLPFGCQLRKSYSRRDSWWLLLQRRCWFRGGRCLPRHGRFAFAASYSRQRLSLLAASALLTKRGPSGEKVLLSRRDHLSESYRLENKEPRRPTAEEICCSSFSSCSRNKSSAKKS